MKKFFIVTRSEDSRNITLLKNIESVIEKMGGSASTGIFPKNEKADANVLENPVPAGTECIISVGGDGTLVFASKMAMSGDIPLVGVNRGHLGYLCDLDDNSVEEAIERLLNDDYEIEERMMLGAGIQDADSAETALNDVVISAGQPTKMISLLVYINGSYLYNVNADGLVFSTPTGSTAYNLSCGGPIVDPKNNVILLTPINAHSMNLRPIVLDQNDEICVEINSRHKEVEERAIVTFDGDKRIEICSGQRIVVRRSDHVANMIRFSKLNFLERISTKFQE